MADRPARKQRMGRWGERLAASYLETRGLQVLARNYRTRAGELDLVARHGNVTVFVEVKARSSDAFGLPEEAVTERKRKHLLEAAQAFLLEFPEWDGDWRVDVIAIRRIPGQHDPEIMWFENAWG
jgi:putative endonuclease